MEQLSPQMPPDALPVPKSSLAGRLINVFAAPGDVFDEIKRSGRRHSNWLVPVLMAAFVGVINVWIIFSQPAVQQQMREQQAKQFQQMVEAGKMKAADAEKMQEQMGPWMFTIMKITGSIGAFVGGFAWLFLIALVLWLLGKCVFKAGFPYMQAVEVAGLSCIIMALGGVAAMLLVMVTGNPMVTVGPALLVGEFNPQNKTHLLLSSINVVTLWYVGVLAVGLARLSGTSFIKASMWLYALWLGLRLAIVFSGLAVTGM